MSTPSVSTIRSICVYCGSHPGNDPSYEKAARALGQEIAKKGLTLTFGGGNRGLMGAVARGVLESGGSVTGIIPEFLKEREQSDGFPPLEGAEIIVVPDMHTRKQMMFDKADAFVALPGGVGTLEELVEIMTWAQLRRHTKPVAVLDLNGFWSPLVALLDEMDNAGFLHNAEGARPLVAKRVEDVVTLLTS